MLRTRDLEAWLPKVSQHRFGVARLEAPFSMAFYDQWLKDGYHGEMSYLERHRDLKAHPSEWSALSSATARSAIVFAIDYVPKDLTVKSDYVTNLALRTALYTRYAPNYADYHLRIRDELQPILLELQRRYPDAQFRLAIDAEPVLERDLAVRAGLGWVGKNTCVIDRSGGSLFFIAEILTSLPIEDGSANAAPKVALIPPKDFCGTCTRCLDACPTEALIEPRRLDATKCISYWTIESKNIPPQNLREKFGDWFFGCDICQTVCPWNGKVFGHERMESESRMPNEDMQATAHRNAVIHDLQQILESSNRELQRRFQGTPFERARGFGLKRNALIVAANLRLTELHPSIELLTKDEKLGDLARDVIATFQR